MFTVVGSGFGLYGYVPALVRSGREVVLPAAYRAKMEARPELAFCLPAIQWASDADQALARASGVVIATLPARQVEEVRACLRRPNLFELILEKPLAPTPVEAMRLLDGLKAAGKRYRVGYTLLHTAWGEHLAWPRADAGDARIALRWTFMAHHFAHGLHNWKRHAAEGGGVLRFFGVHVVALLARAGYDAVEHSALSGEKPDEPQAWEASFRGAGLPDCGVRVDSRSEAREFGITLDQGGERRALVAMGDPFEGERAEGGGDLRVDVLGRLLATLDEDDAAYAALYARVNALWLRVEQA